MMIGVSSSASVQPDLSHEIKIYQDSKNTKKESTSIYQHTLSHSIFFFLELNMKRNSRHSFNLVLQGHVEWYFSFVEFYVANLLA